MMAMDLIFNQIDSGVGGGGYLPYRPFSQAAYLCPCKPRSTFSQDNLRVQIDPSSVHPPLLLFR